jgi:hypothetical protein
MFQVCQGLTRRTCKSRWEDMTQELYFYPPTLKSKLKIKELKTEVISSAQYMNILGCTAMYSGYSSLTATKGTKTR